MLGIIKIRVGLMGLLGLMLVGSFTATSASANPGPFCHHRAIGSEIDDGKISAQTPEQFYGEGTTQTLKGKVAGTEVEIQAPTAQVKGVVYNNAMQCQVKIKDHYQEPKLVKPTITGCVVKVGKENTFELEGHEAWTWDGTKTQLEEQPQKNQKPDWIFLPHGLAEGAKELPKETFVEITFSSCGVLTGTFPVKGSATAARTPEHVGEWGTKETQKFTKGEARQHWWNGKEYVGATTSLVLGTEPSSYEGEFNIKTIGRQQLAPQEIAQFEGP